MRNSALKFLLTLSFILLPAIYALGQPPPPPPQDIPIDGGVLALLLGGLAFVGKKLFSAKKDK